MTLLFSSKRRAGLSAGLIVAYALSFVLAGNLYVLCNHDEGAPHLAVKLTGDSHSQADGDCIDTDCDDSDMDPGPVYTSAKQDQTTAAASGAAAFEIAEVVSARAPPPFFEQARGFRASFTSIQKPVTVLLI